MNIDAADAIALIGLLQHDTLGSNTLSVAGFTEDDIRIVILSGDTFCGIKLLFIFRFQQGHDFRVDVGYFSEVFESGNPLIHLVQR